MTVAIYARVSTQRQAQAQTIEQQLDRLRAHLRAQGEELASEQVFREDSSRVRERNAARNLALLRKIALNLVRADTTLKASLKGKRKYAGWDDAFMAALIAG